jgi:hypothetical protein
LSVISCCGAHFIYWRFAGTLSPACLPLLQSTIIQLFCQ